MTTLSQLQNEILKTTAPDCECANCIQHRQWAKILDEIIQSQPIPIKKVPKRLNPRLR